MIRTETMKTFLETLFKNHSGLRRFEIKDKSGLSEETMSNCIIEGIRNGSIEKIESRFFITQVGVEWLNRNSFIETASFRNSKEDSYQTVGFILSPSTYTSSPTQVSSTVTANMLYPNKTQIENLKEKLTYGLNYYAQTLVEKIDCQEITISIKITKNASSISAFYSILK